MDFYFIKNQKLFYSVNNPVNGTMQCTLNNITSTSEIEIFGKNNFTFYKDCALSTKMGIITHIKKPFLEINLKSLKLNNFNLSNGFKNFSKIIIKDLNFNNNSSIEILDIFNLKVNKYSSYMKYGTLVFVFLILTCYCLKFNDNFRFSRNSYN